MDRPRAGKVRFRGRPDKLERAAPKVAGFKENTMPIYEYRCAECHQVFEEWCKHVEDGNKMRSCPICKGPAKRLISNTSFALKGGGWYATEYGAQKNRAGAEGAADSPAPASSAAEEKKATPPSVAAGG